MWDEGPSRGSCHHLPPSGGVFPKRRSYAQASHLRAREVPKPGPAPIGVPGWASGIPWGPSGVQLGRNLTQSGSNLIQIGRHWDPIGPNIYAQTPDQPPQRTLCYACVALCIQDMVLRCFVRRNLVEAALKVQSYNLIWRYAFSTSVV